MALNIAAIVAGMVMIAYAFVPLYDLFCRVTGFGGTPMTSAAAPGEILDQTITVRFNADVAKDLPWEFGPDQKEITVRLGENMLVSYYAINNSDEPVTGTSIYNVTPESMGAYFNKIECFCFEKQLINPGEKVHFPVSFFIDPEIIHDTLAKNTKTVTLSYTFFKSKD